MKSIKQFLTYATTLMLLNCASQKELSQTKQDNRGYKPFTDPVTDQNYGINKVNEDVYFSLYNKNFVRAVTTLDILCRDVDRDNLGDIVMYAVKLNTPKEVIDGMIGAHSSCGK